MIDFVVVRLSDHCFCLDSQVMRGASCWSDRHLVRAKLHFGFQKLNFNTFKEITSCCTQATLWSMRDKYREVLVEKLNNIESDVEVSGECF